MCICKRYVHLLKMCVHVNGEGTWKRGVHMWMGCEPLIGVHTCEWCAHLWVDRWDCVHRSFTMFHDRWTPLPIKLRLILLIFIFMWKRSRLNWFSKTPRVKQIKTKWIRHILVKNVANKSFKTIKLTSCVIDLKWRHLLTRMSYHTSVKFYIVSKHAHVFVSKQCMQIK